MQYIKYICSLLGGCCPLDIIGNCTTAGVYICHVQVYIHMIIVLQIKNKYFEYTFTNFFLKLNVELKYFFLNGLIYVEIFQKSAVFWIYFFIYLCVTLN